MRLNIIVWFVMLITTGSILSAQEIDADLNSALEISAKEFVEVYSSQPSKQPNYASAIVHMARAHMYLRLYLETDSNTEQVMRAAVEHSRAAVYLLQDFAIQNTVEQPSLDALSRQLAKERSVATNKSSAILDEFSGNAVNLLYKQAVNLYLTIDALNQSIASVKRAEQALEKLKQSNYLEFDEIIHIVNTCALESRQCVAKTGLAMTAFQRCKAINQEISEHISALIKLLTQNKGDKQIISDLIQKQKLIIDFDKKRNAKEKKAFMEAFNLDVLKVKKSISHAEAFALPSLCIGELTQKIMLINKTVSDWMQYLTQS